MARRMRPLLCVVGALCLLAGLLPGGWGGNGWTGTVIGLPSSPLFRSREETFEWRGNAIDQEHIGASDDGEAMPSSRVSSTVYRWEIHVLSWSAALVTLGLFLIVVVLRAASREGAEEPRGDDASP